MSVVLGEFNHSSVVGVNDGRYSISHPLFSRHGVAGVPVSLKPVNYGARYWVHSTATADVARAGMPMRLLHAGLTRPACIRVALLCCLTLTL